MACPLADLPVRRRNPEHVVCALAVGIAAGDEQMVGQPVGIFDRRRAHFLVRPQFHDQPFRRDGECGPDADNRAAAAVPPGNTNDVSGARLGVRCRAGSSRSSL